MPDYPDDNNRLIKRTKLQKLLDVGADKMRGLEAGGLLTPIRFGPPPYAHVFYGTAQAAPLLEHGVPAVPAAPPTLKRAARRRR